MNNISSLINPNELRLRTQTMPEGLFRWRHYRRIAAWWNGDDPTILYQHTRSKALWLVRDGIGQVVFQDATARALLELKGKS